MVDFLEFCLGEKIKSRGIMMIIQMKKEIIYFLTFILKVPFFWLKIKSIPHEFLLTIFLPEENFNIYYTFLKKLMLVNYIERNIV